MDSSSFRKRCEGLRTSRCSSNNDHERIRNLSPGGKKGDLKQEKEIKASWGTMRKHPAVVHDSSVPAHSQQRASDEDSEMGNNRDRTSSADVVLLRHPQFLKHASTTSTDAAEDTNVSAAVHDVSPSAVDSSHPLSLEGLANASTWSPRKPIQLHPRTKPLPVMNPQQSSTPATVSADQDTVDSPSFEDLLSKKCKTSDDDYSELDCDDTNSESTAESSCPSPRNSPVRHFGSRRAEELTELEMHHHDDDHEVLSDIMSQEEEHEQEEAFELLDRINCLSAEFQAHREYEESNSLVWAVQHAASQGVITSQMKQNLLSNIRHGSLDEARDVLYHKCHLVPAVGSVIECPVQPVIDPFIEEAFVSCVDDLAPMDSPDARYHKLHVLKLISDLVTKWVKVVGYERGLSEEHIALTSGSLFLAGSYRLGLNDPNSDIDAVCVVPWHVTQEDFFSSFCALLENTEGVSMLAPVPTAYVPLISLSFLGVCMDLLFARLPMSSVEPSLEIDADHMLVNVHPPSMKSLNAPRVSSMLLCLVPKRRVFRTVLRAVRTWARRRGIYSAKLGYLGGISWSILVAFVCQLYPDAEPAKVFVRFFQVFSEWQWPQPVMLNMIYDAGLGFEMWDPRQNLYDRAHIMPVITPAYPHMNSSVQVSQSTFAVIYEELWRARHLAEMASGVSRSLNIIAQGEADQPSELELKAAAVCKATSFPSSRNDGELECTTSAANVDPWGKLFEPSNFCIRYDCYLVVDFQADSPNAMHVWGKFVQSRLRKLVDSVQHVTSVARVHSFPCYFGHTSTGQTPGSCMFIGVEFQSRRPSHGKQAQPTIVSVEDPEVKCNLEQTIRFFLATDLQQFAEKQPGMDASARVLTWDELPEFMFPSGRAQAEEDRSRYQEELERLGFSPKSMPAFRPSYYGSYARGSRWRGGPRKYAGAGKNKPRRDDRFRDQSAPHSHLTTQAG